MVAFSAVLPAQLRLFQYSLCRVVLMVASDPRAGQGSRQFQYSLCRVVLMVVVVLRLHVFLSSVSVLALSSRFDGPVVFVDAGLETAAFSTRSVESF